MSDDPRPGTTASVERRVERLADKVDVLETRVVSVEVTVAHTREMLGMQFAAVKSGQDAAIAKIDALATTISTAQREGAAMLGDPSATPAGRQILGAIDSADKKAEAALAIGARLEKRMAYLGGGLAVAVFLIQFLTPLIAPLARALFNLPPSP